MCRKILFAGYALSFCIGTHFGIGKHAILITDFKALSVVSPVLGWKNGKTKEKGID